MSYHKQRIEHDSEAIRIKITKLGRGVEAALRHAVEALLTRNNDLAYKTIIGDHPVNRAAEALDKECHFFIARHLPSAGHLRFISSALKMNLLLERMGDYATTIARESTQLTVPLAGRFRAEVEAMAEDALQMFDRALTAYKEQDESLARQTMVFARQVDRDYTNAFKFLTSDDPDHLDKVDLFARLIIISRLERVSDQAKNICEETLFSINGETKKRRPMRIVFLEGDADRYAPLAVAIGRRFFPERGLFESASLNPVKSIRGEVVRFLAEHGLDPEGLEPKHFGRSDSTWSSFDIIVSLNSSYFDYMVKVPFQSAAFEWWLPEIPEGKEPMTEAYQYLHASIEDLIVTVRGDAKVQE